jgi:hypothetical protein
LASASKFSKRAQNSILGQVFDEVMLSGSDITRADLGSEIDFISSPTGLNIKLYPSQKILVRACFGIPFDYKEEIVDVWDVMKENLLYRMKESEFIAYLHDQGRCNLGDWRDMPEDGYGSLVLFAGRRGGKMLGVDEPIPTPTGFKRNGDLVDGDLVFGQDGKSYRVQYAHPIEEIEAYKISFDDGTHTFAHAGHLWHTFTHAERKNLRRRKPPLTQEITEGQCHCGCGADVSSGRRFLRHHHHRVKRSKCAIEGGVRTTAEIASSLRAHTTKRETNHAIQLSSPVELAERVLPVDPYVLGSWLGDGNADCGILTCSDEDAAELAPLYRAAGFTFDKMKSSRQRYSIKGLIRPLRLLGLHKNKHIPHEYLWSSAGQRLALLQGLMDSDGHCAEDGRVEFCNTNEVIARGVYHLAASLGLKPFWGEGTASLNGKDCGKKYRVTWTASLSVFRLTRKLARLPKDVHPRTEWRYITNIEPVGKMQMRCITTENPTHLYLFGANFNVTHNSQVVSAIGGACLRNLLAIRDPQKYYGLVKGSEISFTLMGTDEDSSDRLYKKLRADVNGSPYFTPYLRNNDEGEMRFVTEADRGNRDVVPSISAKAFPCTTRSARGPSNYFLALDEFQFFRSSKDANSSDLYKAATPSTSQFAPPDNPDIADSKILVISSPAQRIGKMYELHENAMKEGASSNTFTMRLSTVEMNPRIPRSKLAQDLKDNPDTFKAEFGGEFLDGSGSYVPEEKFVRCIDRSRPNKTYFDLSSVGRKYFWGLDLGMKKDGTALAIGHLEMTEGKGIELIFDYIDRMIVGERFDGPGVEMVEMEQKYIQHKELVLADIVSWLFYMHQVLPCYRGLTDQHAGSHFKQLLQMNGITEMELKHLNDQINSKMYFALQGFVSHGTARFPDIPKFEREFKQLEATYRNKYVLSVEAPSEKNAHDDMADAAALVALQAQQWIDEEGKLDLDPSGRILQVDPSLLPVVPIQDINGLSLRDLQVMYRADRIRLGMGSTSGMGRAALRRR